jgi:hypothetical protein
MAHQHVCRGSEIYAVMVNLHQYIVFVRAKLGFRTNPNLACIPATGLYLRRNNRMLT